MKKRNYKIYAGLICILLSTACEDQLDINENPNSPATADVQLVLPQAIVATANLSNQFNVYATTFNGMRSNAGGFSGFGNIINYSYTPVTYNGIWVSTYQDPLTDLKYVIDNTEGIDELAYFNAAAKIMKVVNFQRLVDQFGNIPYNDALRGPEGITAPKYDDAATIYQDLFATLDEAIQLIDNSQFPLRLTSASDPLFSEQPSESSQMLAWKKLANTLKLRILIRLSTKVEFSNFVNSGFANVDLGIGFLDDDAIVDPGYELNRPNPSWASFGRNIDGTLALASYIPATYSFGFYNGTKISDAGRGEMIFVNYPSTPHNQLGNEVGNPTIVAGQVTWASNQAGFIGTGVLKGPGMGQPLMLEAESHFLQAEAILRGYMAGGAITAMQTSFRAGIESSFNYLLKNENEAVTAGNPVTMTNSYINTNAGNDLVEISAADTFEERLEAIITQKYIALYMIHGDEAWNEYRRTGYPATVPGGAPAFDMASNKSLATARPDRLPTRIFYPSSEQSYNALNYVNINPFGDLIFWDPN